MYDTDGLDIKIPLRMHKDSKLEVEAALKVHGDWSRSVHPLTRYHGELGPRYHFVSVTIPECLPERLHIIAYANEFAFLYDGMHIFNIYYRVLTRNQTKWRSWKKRIAPNFWKPSVRLRPPNLSVVRAPRKLYKPASSKK